MKEQIEYIKKSLDKYGNVSIHTGKLTEDQMTEFKKHFKVKREPFGYNAFSCL